jgi:hypothetical protein
VLCPDCRYAQERIMRERRPLRDKGKKVRL